MVQDHLQEQADRLKAGKEVCGHLLAAAAQAFSAVSLASIEEPVRIDLRRVGAELFLRFVFTVSGNITPVGLDRALYCPPAKRISLDIKEWRSVWTVSWEVPAWR